MEKAKRSQRRKTITVGARRRKCLGRPEEMQKSNRIRMVSKKLRTTAQKQFAKVKKAKMPMVSTSDISDNKTKTPILLKKAVLTKDSATIRDQKTQKSNLPKFSSAMKKEKVKFSPASEIPEASKASVTAKNVKPKKEPVAASTEAVQQKSEESVSTDSISMAECKKLQWYELTVLGIIGVSGVAIAIATVIGLNFDPWESVEKEMNAIVKDYYISYLYPRLTESGTEQSVAAYQDSGFPTTYLRQLLSFDNAKFAKSAVAFSNEYYVCDTNSTGVRYYPYAPYGPEDYRAEYYWSCQDLVHK